MFVDTSKMKTLDQYVTATVTAMLSIKTLEAQQIRALEIGILSEDETESCKTIIWELRRVMKLYQTQAEHVLERLPSEINHDTILSDLQKNSVACAKKLIRTTKTKKE